MRGIIIVLASTSQLSDAGESLPRRSRVARRCDASPPATAVRPSSSCQLASVAFRHYRLSGGSSKKDITKKCPQLGGNITHRTDAALHLNNNNVDDDDDDSTKTTSPSFLSTGKANVSFNNNGKSNNKNGNSPSNLSPVDRLLLSLTSDRASLLLGSVGILILLLNRLLSFPEDAIEEASRSRIDLLGVFAAGSVLLNGVTKLDVESALADRVALEGIRQDTVLWSGEGRWLLRARPQKMDGRFWSTVEWALPSFLGCSPARSAVLLGISPQTNQRWTPLAMVGILPPNLLSSQSSIFNIASANNTPILDRMLRDDENIKGGTVGGTEAGGARETGGKGPRESYLPTLQALPGRVEFTYLPSNAQEALILPVSRPGGGNDGAVRGDDSDRWKYVVVLGGDTAKSFAPRDIAWCKEIASWIGELV